MVENVLAIVSFLVFCINKALPFIFQGTWCVIDKHNEYTIEIRTL